MDVLSPRSSTAAIFLFLVILFPIGILSAERPIWTKSQWETELENFRLEFYPDIKGGAGGPIPELVECVVNTPKGEIVCRERDCFSTNEIPCSNVRKQLILNEVLLRKEYKSFDEDCDSHGTSEDHSLLDPPYLERNGVNAYIAWQNRLIDSGLKFCDPFKFLRCSPLKKCICYGDTTWVKADDRRPGLRVKNTCAATDGNECHDFAFTSLPYYRALSSIKLQEEVEHSIREVDCVEGMCIPAGLFKGAFTCLYDSTRNRSKKFDGYFSAREGHVGDLQSRNALNLGDTCNIGTHNQLATYTEEEVKSVEVRLKNLEELIARDPEPKFCNPQNFLTCGSSSKCVCKLPSIPDNQKCVFPPEFTSGLQSCDINLFLEQFYKNETVPQWVRGSITFGLQIRHRFSTCQEKQICHKESVGVIYCTCPANSTGGVDCDIPLTKFLTQVRPLSFPMDVASEEEKLKIFLEFNKKAKDLENIFSMFEEGPCDVMANLRAEIFIAQIQLLEKPGTKMKRSDYENLNKAIAEFIKAENTSDATLCQVGLTCQIESKKCVAETRRESLSSLFKKVIKFSKLGCGKKGCSPTPKMINYDDIFDREDKKGHIRNGSRATELYVQEMHKLSDMFNAKVKPLYCQLYELDEGPFDPSRFIERCNSSGVCTLCSPVPDPPETTEDGEMNNLDKMSTTENNQMKTGIAHYDFPNQLLIISTTTILLI